MKKFKILASVIALCLLALCFSIMSSSFNATDLGTIDVELINLENEVISEKEISFDEGDELVSLIEDNFDNVTFKDGMLMSIESFETPDDFSVFISIYVDDEMSEVGLKDIKYKDGSKISFILTEFNYDY